MGWRNSLFSVFNDYNNFSREELSEMDAYQFGVLEGQSMCELSYLFVKNRIELNSFNGFDTFTGMPKETAEPVFQDSWDPDIDPDTFNTVKRLGVDSVETCVNLVKEKVEKTFINSNFKTDIKLFSGLVENTLNENFQKSDFKKAFYVDFDMDIYSPTKYAFNFLMENDLIIPGTIIGYDDWGGTPDYDKFRYGESRAHKEIVDQWGLKVTKLFEIGDSFPHVQNAWIVEDVK
jgi:hypothetical protein